MTSRKGDEVQDDQFQFNCSDITSKDIISIQILYNNKNNVINEIDESFEKFSDDGEDFEITLKENNEPQATLIA